MPLTPRFDVAVNFITDGGHAAVILHYTSNPQPGNQGEVQSIAAEFDQMFGGLLPPRIAADTTYAGVTVRYVGSASGYVAESSEEAAVGTVSSDSVPAEVGLIIRRLGNGPPKRAHGRNFWPGLPESSTDSSYITAVAKTSWNVVAAALTGVQNFASADLTPVVMSKQANQLYEVNACTVQNVLGHQRRRRPFR